MLDKQRAEIDVIDREIVSLFERRMQVVMDVARIKKENGIAIFDASREKEVIAKVQSYLKDATLKEELAEAYETLMKVSKDYQQKQIKAQIVSEADSFECSRMSLYELLQGTGSSRCKTEERHGLTVWVHFLLISVRLIRHKLCHPSFIEVRVIK